MLTCGTVYRLLLILSAFKRSLERVNLNEFLTAYKFSVVSDRVQWIVFFLVFSLFSSDVMSRDHAGLETENCGLGLGLGLVLFGLGLSLSLMKMLVLVSRMSVSWSRSDYRL